jgi:hypothetical protein
MLEVDRFWSYVDKTADCWIWTGHRTNKGYGRYSRTKPLNAPLAHRYAYELTNPSVDSLHYVEQVCGNRLCVRPDHLRMERKTDNAIVGRSPRPLADRFWEKVDKSGECWVWTGGLFRNGYGQIKISNKTSHAHRVSYELNVGPIGPGLSVCHKCDNRGCVRPDHLFLGTTKDNLSDMARKGRSARYKVTKQMIADVKQMRAETRLSRAAIAAKVGVNVSTVAFIIRGVYDNKPYIPD